MTGATAALDRVAELRERFATQAGAVTDRASWEALRATWIGRKQGLVRDLLAGLREVPAAERAGYGQAVNQLKVEVEERLAGLEAELEQAAAASRRAASQVDLTLPGRRPASGRLHPVSMVTEQIEAIFAELGFSVAEGPEVETELHNFELLNMPEGHPARGDHDTFFLEGGGLLRTHTSPVQIRTMLARQPPIRIICPGRVFRCDNDLRHSPMFHQVEALCIDEGVTIGDLKGTLEAFIRRLFDDSTKVRLRPSFFPFTEPSAEVDITCRACKGAGCPTCSGTGWMEILGAGMVDPRVLRACGIDPRRYSGFAFGLGIDRVAMNRYGIPNIRTLFENDVRVLEQVRG